jgi:hypothetical protein
VAAIDSGGVLHMLYTPSAAELRYITFNTATDLFGSSEQIYINSPNGSMESYDISIDANNKPHVAFIDSPVGSDILYYTNRVGGSWKSPVTVQGAGTPQFTSFTLSDENIPELSYATSSALVAAVGNQNDATSFSYATPVASINISSPTANTSVAIDSSGNTWIGYINSSNNVALVKHNDGDSWSTWQTPVTNSNNGDEPSVAIDGSSIYIFYRNGSDADIVYDRYNGSWLGETVLETGTFQDAKAKWSFFNNN